MTKDETKAIADDIIDLLPDNPKHALSTIALTFACVAVATKCADDAAIALLKAALQQMRERGFPDMKTN